MSGSETGLAAELRASGLACEVEARDRLAVVCDPAGGHGAARMRDRLSSEAARAAVVQLARRHGFSNIALELDADDGAGDAPVRRD